MRFTTRKRRQPPTVIIISLIDILIVLLIFLMVTTTFQQPKPAIKLTLPESKEGKPGGDDKSMVVTISKNEPYYHLGNNPVTLDRLQQELVAKITQSPGAKLFIRADTDSSVGRLFKVRDAANAAKFTDVKVFVKPAGQP